MARPTYPDLEMREAGATRAKGRSTLRSLITSLRPQQWTKNLFVLAALPFGLKLFDSAAVAMAMAAFVVFCALSGVVYLVNDLYDRGLSDRVAVVIWSEFGRQPKIGDVTPDGRRFLMLREREAPEPKRLIVVENFHEELKAKVPR